MLPPDDQARRDDAAWAPRESAAPPAGAEELVAGYHDFVQIARGGDSVVYRARQDNLDRDVAVKVVLLDDPETKARFQRELAITVRLGRQHPHIVTVLATGTTRAGQPCLVMDFFELGSLQDRLAERGPLPISEVVAAGSLVSDALSFAHGQGVLHRDVKPQNVLILPTSYVLADFGLARAIDAGHSSSLERFSYRHASPQVLDGEAPTTADDIYSLGSTLYTLLDGRPPFAASDPDEDSALSYLRRARTGEPRELLRTGVPPQLIAIVMRCLAKQPADRFANAGELHDALEAIPTETRNWSPDAPAKPQPRPDPVPAPPEPPAAPKPSAVPVAAPAEPPPVAVSALAQLPAGEPRPAAARPVDVDATGMRPAEPPPPPPDTRSRRWPVLIAIVVVAAVVGVVIGVTRSGNDTPRSQPDPSTSQSVSVSASTSTSSSLAPSQAVPVPSISVTGGQSVGVVLDKSIRPKLKAIKRDADRVTITFTDRSNGRASFVITGADGKTIQKAPAGSPGVTLDGQPAGKQCYRVIAIAPGSGSDFAYGTSGPICTKT